MGFYLDISGVRLDQTTLFAIAEGLMAHALWLLLLAIINCRCLRPLSPRPRWVGAWRVHATAYAILAIATEVMWVQLGLIMGPKGVRENAIGCEWSGEHLMAWTMFQALSLSSIALVCTYCRRAPVGHMITSYIGVHAMALMAFSMMGMNEQGACASDVFPLLTAMVGMAFMCCCFPWYTGAWRIDYPRDGRPQPPDLEALGALPRDEQEALTCWGWRLFERHLRLNPRPYRSDAGGGELLDADQYEQSKISMMLFGEMGSETPRRGANGHRHALAEEVGGFQGESEDVSEDVSEDGSEDDDEKEEVEEPDGDKVVTAKGDGRGRDAVPLEDLPSVADTMRLEPFVANPQEWSAKTRGRAKEKGKEKAEGKAEGKNA